MANITVLGCGGWGTALALSACGQGHKVSLWSPFAAEIAQLSARREHVKLLPGVKIPEEIVLTSELEGVDRADLIIIATPSFAVRETAKRLNAALRGPAIIANAAKGIEEGTLLRLSQVLEQELPSCGIAALSGPSHAEEVARGVPTSLVASSEDPQVAETAQDLMMAPALRVYTNPDITGVELGGALKNVIAVGAGVLDGLGLGDNTKAALITRGLTEIARLGVAAGARRETFAGLAGMGDLVVTCTSMHSRNRRFGILVGQGVAPKEALECVGQTVEGYHATQTACLLAERHGVEMPIASACRGVLYQGVPPEQALRELMNRPRTHEAESTWV